MSENKSPYRESGNCERCVELAEKLGEVKQSLSTYRTRSWLQVLGATAIVGGSIVGSLTLVGYARECASRPPEVEQCHDSVSVISISSSSYSCAPGARVITEPLSGNQVSVRCSCDAPASAPPGAR